MVHRYQRLRGKLQFFDPRMTLICVRRKIRREVIFAFGKAGAGMFRKKPKRNFHSKYSC